MNKSVYIIKDGCNRRMLDMAHIEKYLTQNQYTLTDTPEQAEIILIGTCAFKEKEETQSIMRIEKYQQYRKDVLGILRYPYK